MDVSRRGFSRRLLAVWIGGMTATSASVRAQEPPDRRDVTITIANGRFSPDRVEVNQNDLVRVTVRGDGTAHSFTVDDYRIIKRVPAGGSVTFDFRADRAGTFTFYCSISSEPGHDAKRGTLVVRGR